MWIRLVVDLLIRHFDLLYDKPTINRTSGVWTCTDVAFISLVQAQLFNN